MHFTKNLSTLVTIAIFSALLVGALSAEVGLAEANNNGLNLQTGGNGQGNNGCGNGNGGPSGTKNCTKKDKGGELSDSGSSSSSGALLGTGSALSDSVFDQVVSGSSSSSGQGSSSSSGQSSSGGSGTGGLGGGSGTSFSSGLGQSGQGSSSGLITTSSSDSLTGTSTVPSGGTFKKVPTPTALPGVLILGACGVAARLRKRA